MTYIENVFICMAPPLLIAALYMGKRQTKILSVLPCGNGSMSALRLYQYLFRCALWSGYFCRNCRDCSGSGRSNEASAAAFLSSGV